MDSARDIFTKEIIDAELLWEIPNVDKKRYVCIGCGAKVVPASFDRKINKKRPYFSISKGSHIEPCDIDGEGKIIKNGELVSSTKKSGLPAHFPNKLVFDDIRLVTPTKGFSSDDYTRERGRFRATHGSTGGGTHGHTVKTIRPIARLYMRLRYGREKLPLEIPGCEGTTFANSFWRLTKIMRFNNPTHLYFAPLSWKAPIRNAENIEWLVSAGNWDVNTKKLMEPYRVRVVWADWSQTKKNTLEYEIEAAREKVKLKKGTLTAWLFFIGTQDPNDQSLITVNRYQAICCIEGKKII